MYYILIMFPLFSLVLTMFLPFHLHVISVFQEKNKKKTSKTKTTKTKSILVHIGFQDLS